VSPTTLSRSSSRPAAASLTVRAQSDRHSSDRASARCARKKTLPPSVRIAFWESLAPALRDPGAMLRTSFVPLELPSDFHSS
jgi:hypothetical protein